MLRRLIIEKDNDREVASHDAVRFLFFAEAVRDDFLFFEFSSDDLFRPVCFFCEKLGGVIFALNGEPLSLLKRNDFGFYFEHPSGAGIFVDFDRDFEEIACELDLSESERTAFSQACEEAFRS